jgi:hypothetical protein
LGRDDSRGAFELPKNIVADRLTMTIVFSSPARFVLEPIAQFGKHVTAGGR